MKFSTLAGEALTAALDLDVNTASDAALAAALVPRNESLEALFALSETEATAEQADAVVAITASVGEIEAEQARRAEKAATFAASKAAFAAKKEEDAKKAADAKKAKDDKSKKPEFSNEDPEADEDDAEVEVEEADAEVEADEADAEVEADEADADETDDETDETEVVVEAATKKKTTAASKVGRKAVRPAVKATQEVIITASAGVRGYAVGQELKGMDAVSAAMQARVKGFPQHNPAAAAAVQAQLGGTEENPITNMQPFDVATVTVPAPTHLTAAKESDDYSVVRAALREHEDALVASMQAALRGEDPTLTAAGWCAPSTPVYSFLADFVVDGLLTLPEVSAPRGGLSITTGPRLGGASQGATNLDNFGFIQTEAQAIARTPKTLETIVCPTFVDYRLDAIGYGYTIPFLTQKAYPELITDALKYASVLWAHKVNKYLIDKVVALSDAVTYSGFGPSTTDALEILSLVAMRERRKWDLGRMATMEVKVPEVLLEVFRADMSRRSGLTLDDVATDQKLMAHFAARHLAVEFISDWQEISNASNLVLQGSYDVLIYPSGTFIKALENVVNLSAFYDTASVILNEYTGIFFEQGIMVVKVGYGSSKISINVNTAGETGANILTGKGDSSADGSF